MAAKVRILTIEPDDLLRAEPRRRVEPDDDTKGQAVSRRPREDTQVRRHVFLHQTLPPNDPLVREIERRRSGSEDGEED